MVPILITEISDDPKVQDLLRTYDTGPEDGYLETKEVDADGDGYVDCNDISNKWLPSEIGSVDVSLFNAGLVSKLKFLCVSIDQYNRHYSPDPDSRYYEEELAVTTRDRSRQVNVPEINPDEVKSTKGPKVFLVPDGHGSLQHYRFIQSMLENGDLDFFAMEMIPHTLQPALDTYLDLRTPVDSDAFKAARGELVNYFSWAWNVEFGSRITKGEDNPYFKLVELARERRVRVIALDVDPDYYRNYSIMDMTVVGTRNLVWANQIPQDPDQRGLVFGGTGHFYAYKSLRVQDFLADRIAPERMLLVINFPVTEVTSSQPTSAERKSYWLEGLGIGTGTGAVLGGLLGMRIETDRPGYDNASLGVSFAIGAGIGVIVGIPIGAIIGSTTPKSPKPSVTPAVGLNDAGGATFGMQGIF